MNIRCRVKWLAEYSPVYVRLVFTWTLQKTLSHRLRHVYML